MQDTLCVPSTAPSTHSPRMPFETTALPSFDLVGERRDAVVAATSKMSLSKPPRHLGVDHAIGRCGGTPTSPRLFYALAAHWRLGSCRIIINDCGSALSSTTPQHVPFPEACSLLDSGEPGISGKSSVPTPPDFAGRIGIPSRQVVAYSSRALSRRRRGVRRAWIPRPLRTTSINMRKRGVSNRRIGVPCHDA